jgi:uncharacterized repeat protein (TIGR01451 family)
MLTHKNYRWSTSTINAFSLVLTLTLLGLLVMPSGPANALDENPPQNILLESAFHTITIDGDMSEWTTDELMEVDNGGGFYVTWDATNFYFGLSNVDVERDGGFFLYFDTAPGGNIISRNWYGTHALPFAANYTLGVESDSNITWYVAIGGLWSEVILSGADFYVGFSGNEYSEFQIPRSAFGNPTSIHMMAFFQNPDDNGVTASWPTPNPANNSGSESFTHSYHFPSIVDGIVPHNSVLADHIVINEFRPKGAEYVELFNPTDDIISLQGWYLADAACGAGTSLIGSISLYPGTYLTVNANTSGDNFDMSNDGDTLVLCNNAGNLVDMVSYGYSGGAPLSHTSVEPGNSTARTPNGTDRDDDAADWNVALIPTPGGVNNAPAVLLGSTVVFNEFDNYPLIGNDKIEVYNPTDQLINLNGWLISDGDGIAPIVTSPIINPGAWVVLEETIDWTVAIDFSSTDVGYLFVPNGIRVDQIGFYGEFEDNTLQRIGDGEGPNDGFDWFSSGGGVTWFDLPSTLGISNSIADVQITKSGPEIITPGESITYLIAYANNGFTTAQNVAITDVLPTGVSYLSDTSGLNCPACLPGATGNLIWTMDPLASGANVSFELTGLVDSGLSAGAELVNTATITTTTNDPNLSNNQSQSTTNISALDLSVEKIGPGYSPVGALIEYTININNAGVEAAANVVLTDTLPTYMTYVSDDSGIIPTNPSTGVYTWSIGSVAADTTYSFTIVVSIDPEAPLGTELVNTADVTTSTPNDPQVNNTAHQSTYVITPIHDIQGSAHLSPMNGQLVHTAGIVTVVRSNAFYMQDPNADYNDATSEAIYVYTSISPGVSIGDEVLVTGTVTEYRISNSVTNLTLTEITGPTTTLISSGNSLPATTILGTGGRIPPAQVIENDATGDVEISGTFDPITDGIDFYESLEGMLVQVNDAVAVAATTAYGEIAVVGDSGANSGILSPRGGIVIQDSDMNPERILVDDTLIYSEPQINTGAIFDAPIIGVLDYAFGNFKLFNTQPLAVTDSVLAQETTPLTAGEDQITVATINMENLDPSDGARFTTLADQIVENMHSPDIIALQEIQDNNGATNDGTVDASLTYQTLINAIIEAGGPTYDYRDIAPLDLQDGGEPGGNIRVGFIFRTDRGLTFIDRPGGDAATATSVALGDNGVELSYSPGRIDPLNTAFLDSRKPLAGEFLYHGHTLIVIANHLNSKGGDNPLFGRYQPPVLSSEAQRIAQATVINAFVQNILTLDPQANVIVLGDLNDFQFSPPLDTMIGSELNLLTMLLPEEERYTYIYDGNAQALDHILVSDALLAVAEYDIVHLNSEYLDSVRPTDHDPAITRLYLPASIEISKTVTLPTMVTPGSAVTYTITLSNMGYDRAYGVEFSDILPVGITFGDWIENPGAVHLDGIITWEGSILDDITFVFTAIIALEVQPGSEITNTASYEYLGGSGAESVSFLTQPLYLVTLPITYKSSIP